MSWKSVALGDVCSIINGGTPKSEVAEYWGGDLNWITPKEMGKLKSREISITERKITDKGIKNSSAKLLPVNSVILSSRAPIGHLAINKSLMATNQGCKGLVPSEALDYEYLYYFLSHSKQLLNDMGSGATFKEISGSKLATVQIPLPPLPIQKKIVSKLDTIFFEINKATVATDANAKNFEALFQSYLEKIFSSQGDNWITSKLKDVCEKITDGTHQTPTYFDDGVIFLSSKNVTSGKIDWDRVKYIDSKQHSEMSKRVSPKIGDVLLAKNGTTGVAAMVDKSVVFDIYVSLALLRAREQILPQLLLYFVNSPVAKKQFDSRLKGIGVPNLHLQEIREVEISFPKSLDKQRELILRIESFLELTSLQHERYKNKKNEISKLKNSILKQAFNGELVKE